MTRPQAAPGQSDGEDNGGNIESPPPPKRQWTESQQQSVADDLICPITRELPFDPVIAEDGRVYERNAIEEHIELSIIDLLRSPMTNAHMGRKLLPAAQIKSLIETLIETNAITGTLVETWLARKREEEAVADDLICPIARELPFDPVIAEDGYIYERKSIEEHMASSIDGLKSPMTNAHMGGKLLPAAQIKSLIETLIETGVITGILVRKWLAKKREQEAATKQIREAEQTSDAKKQFLVGANFEEGRYGFKKDMALALEWYSKANKGGYVQATARLGYLIVSGFDKDAPQQDGLVLITLAAERGSDLAAYKLGMALKNGDYGLTQDIDQAMEWLNKCASGECVHKQIEGNKMYQLGAQYQLLE